VEVGEAGVRSRSRGEDDEVRMACTAKNAYKLRSHFNIAMFWITYEKLCFYRSISFSAFQKTSPPPQERG